MNAGMELVEQLDPTGDESPLAKARLQRQLTVEETARRSGLSPEEVRWLEEGRVYRFATPDDALIATLLFATGLGIDADEARRLAGLPSLSTGIRHSAAARYAAVAAAVAVVVGIVLAVVFIPGGGPESRPGATAGPKLPPPWRVRVTVLNGSGDMTYTRRVADHVLSLAYRVKKVARADSFAYQSTSVYFPPGCEAVATRLAEQLSVSAKPLPGGTGACQLYVIVGPERGPG
jgi:transcriptional regulator with XRE-family HTH domain